ncbi:NAD(P)/FAD-dependent oxidoreductase [Terriglobus sp.]|uniref:NAD(P)/FAD-dependent oxidoreductase n=1 Tax=Terriglobus sp. TaxID=1889013 RepID=UPI003B005184
MSMRAASIVIGGGLAGSMAALQLARAGRDVVLLEQTKEAHDKICGDFLSRETLQYLEGAGVDVPSLGGVPIRSVRLITPWFERERPLPFPACSLTRRVLDEQMLCLAAKAAVQVERGACVKALVRDGGAWSANLRDGRSFRAEDAMLATGKLDVHGLARPAGKQEDLVGFKMYFRLTDREQRSLGNAVELILFPGGYAGLQPVESGVANLCLLIHSRVLRSIGSHWNDVLEHILRHAPHLRARLESAMTMLPKPLAASQIPYGHLQRFTQDGLWRVGDQAAVIPSFCGDGMAIALHSGALAASYLTRGMSSNSYQQQLRGQLASRMWLATRTSQLLVSVPQAAQVARVFPALLRTFASYTRVPEQALVSVLDGFPEPRCGGAA